MRLNNSHFEIIHRKNKEKDDVLVWVFHLETKSLCKTLDRWSSLFCKKGQGGKSRFFKVVGEMSY